MRQPRRSISIVWTIAATSPHGHFSAGKIRMRMWMVDPRVLCRKHLLGEHVELHMLVASMRNGISLQGFFDNKLIETHNVVRRQDQLVREMKRRGFKHASLHLAHE